MINPMKRLHQPIQRMTEVQKADPKGRQLEFGAQGPVAPRLPVYDKTMQWNNYKWVFGEDWEHKNPIQRIPEG